MACKFLLGASHMEIHVCLTDHQSIHRDCRRRCHHRTLRQCSNTILLHRYQPTNTHLLIHLRPTTTLVMSNVHRITPTTAPTSLASGLLFHIAFPWKEEMVHLVIKRRQRAGDAVMAMSSTWIRLLIASGTTFMVNNFLYYLSQLS